MRPIFIVRFVLRFLEAMQSRQCFLEIRSMPYRHRIGIHQIRTDPPITTIYINFFFCGNMTVVFACKSVHFKDDFFRATQFNHRLSEPRVTDKSIVNVFVVFLSTPPLKLFCRVELFATFFLPVSMTVWPALPDVEVRDSEEIQHGRDILLVFCCIIFARSVHTCSRRCQRPNTSGMLCIVISAPRRLSRISSVFPAAVIASFDSLLKGLNARCC